MDGDSMRALDIRTISDTSSLGSDTLLTRTTSSQGVKTMLYTKASLLDSTFIRAKRTLP